MDAVQKTVAWQAQRVALRIRSGMIRLRMSEESQGGLGWGKLASFEVTFGEKKRIRAPKEPLPGACGRMVPERP